MLEDEMLTIDEVASFLKLRPQTIYRWAQSGMIPGAKFGKEWRFRRSAIERWLESFIPAGGADGRGQRREEPSKEPAVVPSASPAGVVRRGTRARKASQGPDAN